MHSMRNSRKTTNSAFMSEASGTAVFLALLLMSLSGCAEGAARPGMQLAEVSIHDHGRAYGHFESYRPVECMPAGPTQSPSSWRWPLVYIDGDDELQMMQLGTGCFAEVCLVFITLFLPNQV